MFAVIAIRHVIRRTPNLQPVRRKFDIRNKIFVKEGKFMRVDTPPNFEKFDNSKLVPKGYRVIYVTPMKSTLIWCYIALPVFWTLYFIDLHKFYRNPDSYVENFAKTYKGFSVREKIAISIAAFTVLSLLQILPAKSAVAIFRKGNEFQTLRFGLLLGPLHKIYVHHGLHAMEPTAYEGIYRLKGKLTMVISSGFRSFQDFASVLKYHEK